MMDAYEQPTSSQALPHFSDSVTPQSVSVNSSYTFQNSPILNGTAISDSKPLGDRSSSNRSDSILNLAKQQLGPSLLRFD